MDVYEKIRQGYYKNCIPYPKKPVKPRLHDATSEEAKKFVKVLEKWEKDVVVYESERDAWRKEENKVYELIKRDCLEEVGLLGHEKADKAWSYAWEHGHSSGYNDVYLVLEEIAELIK